MKRHTATQCSTTRGVRLDDPRPCRWIPCSTWHLHQDHGHDTVTHEAVQRGQDRPECHGSKLTFRSCAQNGKENVTVHQLLTHTSVCRSGGRCSPHQRRTRPRAAGLHPANCEADVRPRARKTYSDLRLPDWLGFLVETDPPGPRCTERITSRNRDLQPLGLKAHHLYCRGPRLLHRTDVGGHLPIGNPSAYAMVDESSDYPGKGSHTPHISSNLQPLIPPPHPIIF